ncbi:MAG: winged helix-turn-helix transcriptional regulator [Candidatus Woesearchaeota archaeon]|jgi:Lrp/AsnC family transcriptional regulator for asnA, asnC and gidA
MSLDKKDIQILSILDWNARMPLTQIAKKTKLNKDVVRYRIKNLEEKGIIEGYYTLIDMSKLGYLTSRIYFDFIDITKEIEKEIISYLDKIFKAGDIFSRDGIYQLGIISWEKSIYELKDKLQKFKESFGDYIRNMEFTIFTEFNHYSLSDFNKVFFEYVSISLKSQEETFLKDDDLKILKEIADNSRITSVELSSKLTIPQTTVIYKIKELEKKKIILSYRAKIDYSKLDYENYYLEILTHNGLHVEEIESYLKIHKNCSYSVSGIFGADIEVECEFKSRKDLIIFIGELKSKFKFIRKIGYCTTLKYYKIKYFPD